MLAHPHSAQRPMVPLAVGLPAPPHRRTLGPAVGTRRHKPEEKYGKCQRRKGTGSGPRRGFLRRKGGGSCGGRVQEGSRKGPGRVAPVQEGGGGLLCKKGLPRGFLGWFLCRKGWGVPVQDGGSWGVLGTVPVQEGGGFLSDMHMPQPTHCAQFKPSNSPHLASPLPLTLGKQY